MDTPSFTDSTWDLEVAILEHEPAESLWLDSHLPANPE